MPSSTAADERSGGVLLDSSFLVAFHNERDAHHARALLGMEDLLAGRWGQAYLLEYVFLEVATVLLLRRGLATARSVVDLLERAAELEILPCSELFAATLDTFRGQRDTSLSFTDAALVAAARQLGISRIATFDEGFRGVRSLTLVPG